jgi:hypothetical protein
MSHIQNLKPIFNNYTYTITRNTTWPIRVLNTPKGFPQHSQIFFPKFEAPLSTNLNDAFGYHLSKIPNCSNNLRPVLVSPIPIDKHITNFHHPLIKSNHLIPLKLEGTTKPSNCLLKLPMTNHAKLEAKGTHINTISSLF